MQAIQAAGFSIFTSSNLREKLVHLPCRFDAKKPVFRDNIVQTLTVHKGKLALTFIACATQNENDEPERGGSNACTNDAILTNSENNESSKDPGEAAVTSLLYSDPDCVRNVENLGNQVNLLDKLKAVHLHVLAMEQWNASRLELCHRYVFLFLEKLQLTCLHRSFTFTYYAVLY